MKAIVNKKLAARGSGLVLEDVPKPSAGSGELLLKVECCILAPADELLLEGKYYKSKDAPFIPGLLAIGKVVGSADDQHPLLGSRVWFSPGVARPGAWAEFAVADAPACIPLDASVPNEIAVNLGNALTAVGLVQEAQSNGAKAAVMTAAAGNLGAFVSSQAAKKGLPIINVVRRHEQAEQLRRAGCEMVIDRSEEGFAETLSQLAEQASATVLFDSLGGGPALKSVMRAMPNGSLVMIVGSLERQPMEIDSLRMLHDQRLLVQGFGINEWLGERTAEEAGGVVGDAMALLSSSDAPRAGCEVSLKELVERFSRLTTQTTGGRTMIVPSRNASQG